MKTEIQVNNGKYTVVIDEGNLSALRYGEPWQDLCGNNLVYWLAVELQEAREKLNIATEALKVYADSGNCKNGYSGLAARVLKEIA